MVIINQALNTSSSRRLGKALQTCSNRDQDREKGLIEHHRLGDGGKKKKDTVHCLELHRLGSYSFCLRSYHISHFSVLISLTWGKYLLSAGYRALVTIMLHTCSRRSQSCACFRSRGRNPDFLFSFCFCFPSRFGLPTFLFPLAVPWQLLALF